MDFINSIEKLGSTATPLINAIKGKPDSTSQAPATPQAAQAEAKKAAPSWMKPAIIGGAILAAVGLVVWLVKK